MEVHADWNRQLRVLDPRGRQLLISCGCALFNARVALAADGHHVNVERFPDRERSDVVARLTLTGESGQPLPIGALDPSIDERRTNRRRFADDLVPAELVNGLVAAAKAEGAELVQVTSSDDLRTIARLSQQADKLEIEDPAYRAELEAWTTDDPRRLDGVQAASAPFAGVDSSSGGNSDSVPIRVFDTTGMGWLPADAGSSTDQCLLLLGTARDDRAAWVAAGEALERVFLEITRSGYAASPLTQLIEVTRTCEKLRNGLKLKMHPDVLLRVGRAPETVATRRRPLADLINGMD